MFSGLFVNAWIVASIVAVVAGAVGLFTVLRGQTFAAHALPQGAFAGAAGSALVGVSAYYGLGLFSVLGALGIAALGRRGRRDVATALALVLLLGLGALFLSSRAEYAPAVYSLLFGEVLGVSRSEILPTCCLGVATLLALGVAYRPLLLSSALPEIADAQGLRSTRVDAVFLVGVALVTTMSVPVVGAFLMFSLMVGPAGAARSLTRRPGVALVVSIALALVVAWASIALAYATNWPIGVFVGVGGALVFTVGRALARIGRGAPRWA